MKKINLCLILLLGLTSVISQTNQEQEAKELYKFVKNQVCGAQQEQAEEAFIPNPFKPEMRDDSLSVYDQHVLGFNLIQSFLPHNDVLVADKATIQALDLLSSHGDVKKGLLSLMPTRTVIGRAYAACKLVFPHTDSKDAMASQRVIAYLTQHQQVKQRFDEQINHMQLAEERFLSLYKDEHPANKQLLERFYFKRLNFLNKSSLLQGLSYRLGNGLKINQLLLGQPLMQYVIRAFSHGMDCVVRDKSGLEVVKSALLNPLSDAYDLAKHTPEIVAGVKKMATNILNTMPDDKKLLIKAGATGVGALCAGFVVFNGYVLLEYVLVEERFSNYIQQKMIAAAEYVRCIKELDKLVQSHDVLKQNLVFADTLHAFVQKEGFSHDFAKLIGLLETNTFTGNASFFSRKGRVFAAYRLMQEVKDEFAPFVTALGEIDAHCAVAHEYLEKNNKNGAKYTFVEFIEDSVVPYIEAVDFWNMHLDSEKAVVNSLCFGGDKPASLVATGLNRGGKSTIFKALALNSILAQSFGIAAAQRWVATPFAHINCYLDIVDDVQSGKSTFQAEVERAVQLLQSASECSGNDKVLFVLDELFTGTAPEAGAAATCAFAQKLSQLSHVSAIFVSHYHELSEIAQNKQELFTNYSVVTEKQADGSFIPTYRIAEGRSLQNDAIWMLEQAGLV